MDLQVECDFLFDMQDDVGVWLCCLDPSVVRQIVLFVDLELGLYLGMEFELAQYLIWMSWLWQFWFEFQSLVFFF